jgi:hypothetical protein
MPRKVADLGAALGDVAVAEAVLILAADTRSAVSSGRISSSATRIR